jgi:hypothetical protein
MDSRLDFNALYRKWYDTIGDPRKNLIVSKSGRAMAWRMGFFYLARIMSIDCLKVDPSRRPDGGDLRKHNYNIVIEINVRTMLN